jgi:hypothetical protein
MYREEKKEDEKEEDPIAVAYHMVLGGRKRETPANFSPPS